MTRINLLTPWRLRRKLHNDANVNEEDITEVDPSQRKDDFEGNKHWSDFDHAVKIHRIVEAVRNSSQQGRVITL